MGDKSPKSRDKSKKQGAKKKASDKASAKRKQDATSTVSPILTKPGK